MKLSTKEILLIFLYTFFSSSVEEFVEVLGNGKFYMPTNEFIEELKITGFEFNNTWITDPTKSECGRFEVDPKEYYGIDK